MKIAYTILILNSGLCTAFFFEHWIAGAILTFIWLISAVGLIGFHKTGKKGFAIAAYAGFVPFFPIGLLAVIGIRRKMEQAEQTNESTPEPLEIFYFSRRFLNIWLILGCCFIAAQAATQIWLKFPNPVGAVGLVFVIVSITLRKSRLIEIFPDNFTYKPGPLAASKRIYLSDIKEIVETKKKLTLQFKGGFRQQKIMMDLLASSDRPKLKAFLSKARLGGPPP
jgi:hypothetical protein